MDGFAVRFQDTQEAPSTLDIIATSQAAAGDEQLTVSTGQTVRIMTGAPVPDGADAIIPIAVRAVMPTCYLNQPSKPHFIESAVKILQKDKLGLRRVAT